MCWGLRIDIPANGRAAGIEDVRGFADRIAISGRAVPALIGDDASRQWMVTGFGIQMPSVTGMRRYWNARKDALQTNTAWTALVRQRAIIPVTAYVEHRPNEEWKTGDRAWALAIYRSGQNGGLAVITDENQSPILTTQEDAIAWLNAKQWDAIPLLNKVARVEFSEPDLFTQSRLSQDARSRVPIERKTA